MDERCVQIATTTHETADSQILRDRQPVERPPPLGDVRNPETRDAVGPLVIDASTFEQDAAAHSDETADRAKKRRLPRPVPPEPEANTPRRDAKRDIVQYVHVAIAGRHPVELERDAAHALSPR